ncbi:MAG: type I CRISPR-associated protein Cas7 [bacterium]
MEKRVYGLIGIKSVMANWNADFEGLPKTISDGQTFGSDKALKYPIKKMWENEGEKILYIKSFKQDEKDKKLRPRSLKERYELIFEVDDLSKQKESNLVLENLFKATDVKNFGSTFAEAGNNFSITGAVQITQGFNKYEDTQPEEQQILSPFRDGTKDSADQSTLGTKIVSNEAHYVYHFAINPNAYDDYVKLGVTDGYTEQDYTKFKNAALISATSFNTNSKVGCENEFAVFIETEKNAYLPDLAQYVTFEKVEDGKNIFTFNFDKIIGDLKDKIKAVEIYYNPYTTEIKADIKKAKYFNIFTQDEVK